MSHLCTSDRLSYGHGLIPSPLNVCSAAGELARNRETLMPSAALRILLPLSLALALPLAAHAQISEDVVKIGVLTDLSGPASTPTGPGSVLAAQMAVDDFGGRIAGKPITVISADHQIKPDVGAAIARRWYDVEQIDLIVDVPVSAVGLALQNVAKEKKKMM